MNKFDLEKVSSAIKELLLAFGDDPTREGLEGTPNRSAKAWQEMLSGNTLNISDALKTSDGKDGFKDVNGYDQMVVLAKIPFWSTCEHHLLPFGGTADVGYIPGPDGVVVGLSKLARLVDLYAKRLQVQERMTEEIAEALDNHLKPSGVGVTIKAVHQCMTCRGVKKVGAAMITEVVKGSFRDHVVRDEFWHLCERVK